MFPSHRQPTNLADTVRGALVNQISLDEDHAALTLDLTLRPQEPGRGSHNQERACLRILRIANMGRVRGFFFGRKLKPVGDHVDQVLEFKETRNGCSVELRRAGRVAIRTADRPALECEEAVEQADAADEARVGKSSRGLRS